MNRVFTLDAEGCERQAEKFNTNKHNDQQIRTYLLQIGEWIKDNPDSNFEERWEIWVLIAHEPEILN